MMNTKHIDLNGFESGQDQAAENKISKQWYETNMELYNSEISQILSFCNYAKIQYLDNGNMCWDVSVAIKSGDKKHVWRFEVAYDKDYDGVNEKAIKIYSLSPTYEEIKEKLARRYGKVDFIPYTKVDENGKNYISYYDNSKLTEINAIEKLKEVYKWVTYIERSLISQGSWITLLELYNSDLEKERADAYSQENSDDYENQEISEERYDENEEINSWIKVSPDKRKKEIEYLKETNKEFSFQIGNDGSLSAPYRIGEYVFLMVIDKCFPEKTEQDTVPVRVYLVAPKVREIKQKYNINYVPNVKVDSNGCDYITMSGIAREFEKYISGDTDESFVELVKKNTAKWFAEISTAIYEDASNHSVDADYDRFSSSNKRKKYVDARVSRDNEANQRCKKVVLSNRAYAQILSETYNRVRTETGGLLLGHFVNGVWYVVEASDPGINAVFSAAYHEGDEAYENHVCGVYSRLYKHPLVFLGMWHRHPGSMDTFSGTDDQTNYKFAGSCGNGCISALINLDPNFRITFYYVEQGERGSVHYSKVDIEVGDDKFENAEVLKLATDNDVVSRIRGGR